MPAGGAGTGGNRGDCLTRMAEEVLLIVTTWPEADAARAASRTLVEEKLIACANILPGVESIYRWQGKVETSAEVMVLMKTSIGRYSEVEARIHALHSYELPEIVAFRASEGLPAYLRWVEESVLGG